MQTSALAYAANECGVPASGQVICAPSSYPNGITYNTASPLDVVLDQLGNAHVVVTDGGIQLTGSADQQISLSRRISGSSTSGPDILSNAGDAINITNQTGGIDVNLTDNVSNSDVTIVGLNNGIAISSSSTGQSSVILDRGTITARNGSAITADILGPISIDAGGTSLFATQSGINILQTGSSGVINVTSSGPITSAFAATADTGISIGTTNAANTDAINVTVGGPISNVVAGVLVISRGARNVSVATTNAADIVAAQDAINITTIGNGSITVTAASNLTGDSNSGTVGKVVSLTTDSGDITLTTSAGKTLNTLRGPNVIQAVSSTGNISITNGASLSGVNATGISASTGGGSILVNSSGDIGTQLQPAGGPAFDANMTAGAGSITINSTSSIVSNGGNALSAVNQGTGGNSIVLGGPGIAAIQGNGVTSTVTTGANILDVGTSISALNGTAILLTSLGNGSTLTIRSGATITGSTGIAASIGAFDISNAGSVVGGANGHAVILSPDATHSALFSNLAGASLLGSGQTAAASTISLSGAGALVLQNDGTIDTSVGNHLGDLYTGDGVGAATIRNNATGSLNGRLFTQTGTISVENAGIWRTNGDNYFSASSAASVTTLSNTGTISLGADLGTAVSQTSFMGLSQFNNRGNLTLANNFAGDSLRISGSYNGGAGSHMALDIAEINGAVVADVVTIGGKATGGTTITLVPQGNIGFTSGTLLVKANASSESGAFTLDPASTHVGLTTSVIRFDGSTGEYRLVSAPNANVGELVQYSEIRHNLWFSTQDAWEGHMRSVVDAQGIGGDALASGFYTWGQLLGGGSDRHQNQFFGGQRDIMSNTGYRQNYFGGQLGIEIVQQLPHGSATIGVTSGYVGSDAKFHGSGDNLSLNEYNIGGYANYNSAGIFISTLLKFDAGSMEQKRNAALDLGKLRTRQFGATLQLGYHILTRWASIEPAVSASYVRGYIATHGGSSDLTTVNVAGGSISFPNDNAARAKASIRATGHSIAIGKLAMTPYLEGGLIENFARQDRVAVVFEGTQETLHNARPSTLGSAVVGADLVVSERLVVGARANGEFGRGLKSGGGILNVRYRL